MKASGMDFGQQKPPHAPLLPSLQLQPPPALLVLQLSQSWRRERRLVESNVRIVMENLLCLRPPLNKGAEASPYASIYSILAPLTLDLPTAAPISFIWMP